MSIILDALKKAKGSADRAATERPVSIETRKRMAEALSSSASDVSPLAMLDAEEKQVGRRVRARSKRRFGGVFALGILLFLVLPVLGVGMASEWKLSNVSKVFDLSNIWKFLPPPPQSMAPAPFMLPHKEFRVTGIMTDPLGKQPHMAIINEKLVVEGEEFEGARLTKVGGDYVNLDWFGRTIRVEVK